MSRSITYFLCFDFDTMKTTSVLHWRTKLFGHAWIIIPLTDDKCLILDKTNVGFKIVPFECKGIDLAKRLVDNACEVYEVPVLRNQINRTIEIFTCTGFVKKVLNIKPFWILTPKQLRSYIHGRHTKVSGTSC